MENIFDQIRCVRKELAEKLGEIKRQPRYAWDLAPELRIASLELDKLVLALSKRLCELHGQVYLPDSDRPEFSLDNAGKMYSKAHDRYLNARDRHDRALERGQHAAVSKWKREMESADRDMNTYKSEMEKWRPFVIAD